MSVSILDYGVGNLGSVRNMFRRIGVEASFVQTPEQIRSSERLLLPGVGSFDNAVNKLSLNDVLEPLRNFAASGKPLLGICLGMQLLMDSSAEGALPGLGLIGGTCVRFSTERNLRVPHMGWNTIRPRQDDGIFEGLQDNARFYFVHSYFAIPTNSTNVLATTQHGDDFASMIRKDNVLGAQFHPEKSHAFGMRLLTNFAAS